MLAAVTAVNKRVTSLARVLNSETVADGVVVESSNPKTPVHAMVKRKDGATYVFSAAMYCEATKATFRVKGLAGKADGRALGEGRTIRVNNGLFTMRWPATACICTGLRSSVRQPPKRLLRRTRELL